MASRAFTARLSSASSKAPKSASIGQTSSAIVGAELNVLPHALAEQFAQGFAMLPADQRVRDAAPADGRTPAADVSVRMPRQDASWVRRNALSRNRTSPDWARTCSPLMITMSRLLKSCAIPPVSWPIASSFCIWNSSACALDARRSLGLDPPVQIGVDPFQFGVCLTQLHCPFGHPLIQRLVGRVQFLVGRLQFFGKHGGLFQRRPQLPRRALLLQRVASSTRPFPPRAVG